MQTDTTNHTHTVIMAFVFSFRLHISRMRDNCSHKHHESQALRMSHFDRRDKKNAYSRMLC